MFILATSEYLPEKVVDNEYFSALLGKPPSWFEDRTGILQRRRAGADENVHTMAVGAVAALQAQGASLADVDLVIAASYTPLDTIGTIAHVVQRQFNLQGARTMYISTACSSFMDALDVAYVYFKAGKASKALIVAVEHNSAYARDDDPMSGHLWGDGASAVLVGNTAAASAFEVVQIDTKGLADQGHGPEAVSLTAARGLTMPYGREVFTRACEEMAAAVRSLLAGNRLDIGHVRLLVPHQANKRILDHVANDLELPKDRVALTIDSLGNTGCASVAIALHRFGHAVAAGEWIVLVTFGGGYSVGAALLRRTITRPS
jgi:3-oxoacyl-[acyl-carrier-protein] synthase III